MTGDECLYYGLVVMIPFAIIGIVLWAAWGKFEDEFTGYDK